MDRKTKKKLDKVHQQLQNLRQRLAGAKKQQDEPGEVEHLEQQIAQLESEANKLKSAG
jgi:archaellum component FlaC